MRLSNAPPPKPRGLRFYVTKVVTIIICSILVMYSRLIEVMFRSRNIIQSVMWISYFCYAMFFSIWFYTAFFVQPKHPNWGETHKHIVHTATAAVSLGGLLWTIAVWPVYHIWTLPLGFVVLTLFLDIVALIPSFSRKSKE
ncbi:uncharacterized protein TM35_000341600 [Trypanosoma theileri]|uniref:Transmembrane protein n=1 Tax=Trypanosoma theileri TaxID=67003 RepID=A0A1X0NLY5_9TRYP|nr:uncharacterized protein TM35_000341600 [Trypanosoma theileri]ORC85548.1 hypothetical protein TM35_000341600 [Trypanosoma theileri]